MDEICNICSGPKTGYNIGICNGCYKREWAKVNNQTYIDRRTLGLCGSCGDQITDGSFTKCKVCRAHNSKSAKKIRINNIKNGMCASCGKSQPINNTQLCQICLDRRAIVRVKHNKKLKDAAFNAYGGYKCNCCGVTFEAYLLLDHINGGGRQHRDQIVKEQRGGKSKGSGTGCQIYRWLKKYNYPSGLLQVLCANCSLAKDRKIVCTHTITH